jgi:hypothetical protein
VAIRGRGETLVVELGIDGLAPILPLFMVIVIVSEAMRYWPDISL